jgi:hypothetical protein
MKAQFFLVITFTLMIAYNQTFAQGVAINSDNSAPDPSAMLDMKSLDKRLLVPRVNQAQRVSTAHTAITRRDNSLLFFRTIPGWIKTIFHK